MLSKSIISFHILVFVISDHNTAKSNYLSKVLYIRNLQFHKDEEDPKQSLTFCGHIRSCLYSSQEKDTENPGLDSDYVSFCAPIGECPSLMFHKFVTCLTLGMNNQIRKVIEEKRQHKWRVQIMKELVNRMSSYDFEIEVRSPPPLIKGDGDGGVFDISGIKLQDLEHQKSNIVQKMEMTRKETEERRYHFQLHRSKK
ncbi:hypothetical protein SASPL_111131 [Salvia splendens]|uniref:Uncharacterized protein n=1 Tax=Salvia splendens TaxID=180675 RepID=A0A8X8Y6Q5_SALSN|nr:hypothetical protein SASPL_111131 [Salvia splendens]